jgi:hypothetical protein
MHDSDPPLAPGAPAGFANLYKSDLCGAEEAYEATTTVKPPKREPAQFLLELQGISADGTTTVYRADDALTSNAPNVPFETFLAYVAREGATKPRLICILPGGAPIGTGGCSAGTGGPDKNGRTGSVSNAVSEDGSRIYWSAANKNPGPIYLRENPFGAGTECVGATAPCSIAVSGSVASGSAQFWTAAADGSKAIFTVLGGGASQDKLYEFDTEAKASTLIAEEVDGVLGASEDASRIYFLSKDVLTSVPNADGEVAAASKPNLYLYEAAEGGGGSFSFIATLSEADAKSQMSGSGRRAKRNARPKARGASSRPRAVASA